MLTKKHPKALQAVAVKRLLFGLGDVITSTKDTFLNVQVVCEACYKDLNTSIFNIAQKFYWFTTALVALPRLS